MRAYRTIFDSRSHMRVLVAVADTGNMSKASEILGTTQPAISRVVARLEEIVDSKLFKRRRGRTRHGVEPTMIGIIVAHRARMILHEMDEAERAIDKIRDILDGLDREDESAHASPDQEDAA